MAIDRQAEKSLILSALCFGINPGVQKSRKRFRRQVILSLFLDGEELGVADVQERYQKQFGRHVEEQAISSLITDLVRSGELKTVEGACYILSAQQSKKMCERSKEVKKGWDEIVKQISDNASKQGQWDISQCKSCHDRIRRALIGYFRYFAFEHFEGRTDNAQKKEAINKMVFGQLSEDVADNLRQAINGVLSKPSDEQKQTLNDVAKAFLFMQAAQLDPELNEFQITKFRNKVFVLDTEVVIPCLLRYVDKSEVYRTLVKKLLDMGCQVVIPQSVLEEVVDHIKASRYWYYEMLNKIGAVDIEYIRQRAANLFFEEYCRSKEYYASFSIFFNNYYNQKNPVDLVKELLDEEYQGLVYSDEYTLCEKYAFADETVVRQFVERMYEATQNAEKGGRRNEEGNRRIAEGDAGIYLAVCEKANRETGTGTGSLRHNIYIVTFSRRAERCAGECKLPDDVTANPNVLTSVLANIGDFGDSSTNYLHLFENPYLAQLADDNWACIDKAIKAGLDLRGANLQQLQRKLDGSLDEWVRSKSQEDLVKVVTKAEGIGISPGPELRENLCLKQKLDEMTASNKQKDEIIERLTKKKKPKDYLRRMKKGM